MFEDGSASPGAPLELVQEQLGLQTGVFWEEIFVTGMRVVFEMVLCRVRWEREADPRMCWGDGSCCWVSGRAKSHWSEGN